VLKPVVNPSGLKMFSTCCFCRTNSNSCV